jgi:hypothetical protein
MFRHQQATRLTLEEASVRHPCRGPTVHQSRRSYGPYPLGAPRARVHGHRGSEARRTGLLPERSPTVRQQGHPRDLLHHVGPRGLPQALRRSTSHRLGEDGARRKDGVLPGRAHRRWGRGSGVDGGRPGQGPTDHRRERELMAAKTRSETRRGPWTQQEPGRYVVYSHR